MKQLVGVILGAVALLVVSATPARAQWWVSGGYGVQDWSPQGPRVNSGAFVVDFGRVIHKTSKTAGALYADFSFATINEDLDEFDENDTGIVGGFREIFLVSTHIHPFVHASIGNMHFSQGMGEFTGNDLLVGGGGGVMFTFNDKCGVKVQYDIWAPHEDGLWNGNINRWMGAFTYMWGSSK